MKTKAHPLRDGPRIKTLARDSSPATGSVHFGVKFTPQQEAALKADTESPRWDLNPPQREDYDTDYTYGLALRQYADRLIAANAKPLASEECPACAGKGYIYWIPAWGTEPRGDKCDRCEGTGIKH